MIIFTFKRSIRAEVVTYRLAIAVGSVKMQQLHGFDELRNDEVINRNRGAKIVTTALPLCLSASYLVFGFWTSQSE
jgi:hypothetical protein